MRITFRKDEFYPVFYMSGGDELELDWTEDQIAQYKLIMDSFQKLQGDLYDEWDKQRRVRYKREERERLQALSDTPSTDPLHKEGQKKRNHV